MSIRTDSSVTRMQHRLLCDLDFFLENTVAATGFDDSFETYTLDEFRRLYNDAVECRNYYRHLLDVAISETDALQERIAFLEDQLMQLTDS